MLENGLEEQKLFQGRVPVGWNPLNEAASEEFLLPTTYSSGISTYEKQSVLEISKPPLEVNLDIETFTLLVPLDLYSWWNICVRCWSWRHENCNPSFIFIIQLSASVDGRIIKQY